MKLSKDKRDKLILTCLISIGIAGVLYTFILGAQKDKLSVLHKQGLMARDKLAKAERLARSSPIIEADLKASEEILEARSETMAPQGQYYLWFLKSMEQFASQIKVNHRFIMDITQPEFIDVGLVPNFPYKGASFGMRLNGQFDEVGRFIADLENNFPYFRVQNLKIVPHRSPITGLTSSKLTTNLPEANDSLIVELRVVTLIRGGTS